MQFILILVIFILLLPPFAKSEPLIRVCSSSQYKRIVEDTCSSVYKRSGHLQPLDKFTSSDLVAIALDKRSIEDESSVNKLEKDISVKCCVIGCPYSLYAAHCELRKRNQFWNSDTDDLDIEEEE